MREFVEHTMTEEQLASFLAANGLHLDGNLLLAPEGEIVGLIGRFGQAAWTVLAVEERRRHRGREVKAWWPGFRPAWTLTTADGGVEVGETLGPDVVVCDLCNADVTIRPVPVVDGYAHCATCFARGDIPFPGRVRPYEVQPEPEDGDR